MWVKKFDDAVAEYLGTKCKQTTEKILNYIKQKYQPISIIVYGSYANKTNDESSDFDALVISDCENQKHDISLVEGVHLDVYIYDKDYSRKNINNFVHISDGIIVYDNDQFGEKFLKEVREIKNFLTLKSEEEILYDIEWCKKMCNRAKRNDAEGLFRLHWVLVDSLEIFCNINKKIYEGPKKSLAFMKDEYPDGYKRYFNALKKGDFVEIEGWVRYLEELTHKK